MEADQKRRGDKSKETRRPIIIGLILSSSNSANKDTILKIGVNESFPSLFETRDLPSPVPVFQITQHCCGPAAGDGGESMRGECVCGGGGEYRKRVEEEQTAAEEVEKRRGERGERIRARIHRRVAGKARG